MKVLSWSKIVDIVTIIWLAIFIFGFFASPALAGTLRIANIVILSVFVADLLVSYSKVRSLQLFVRKHWFDILMVIPYFRIFRIARILRLVQFVYIARATKAVKVVGASKFFKGAMFGKVSLIMHEAGDLLRTIKSRFVR